MAVHRRTSSTMDKSFFSESRHENSLALQLLLLQWQNRAFVLQQNHTRTAYLPNQGLVLWFVNGLLVGDIWVFKTTSFHKKFEDTTTLGFNGIVRCRTGIKRFPELFQ